MTFKKYNHTNNAFCELLTDLQSSDTTMMLQGNFNRFPTSNFIVKISKYQDTKCVARENIYVANRNNNICTGLVRAYEKVPMNDDATENIKQALNFASGDIVEVVVSSEFLGDIQKGIEEAQLNPIQKYTTQILVSSGTNVWTKIGRFSGTQGSRLYLKFLGGAGFGANDPSNSSICEAILTLGNATHTKNFTGFWQKSFGGTSIITHLRVIRVDNYTWDIAVQHGGYRNGTMVEVSHSGEFLPEFRQFSAPNVSGDTIYNIEESRSSINLSEFPEDSNYSNLSDTFPFVKNGQNKKVTIENLKKWIFNVGTSVQSGKWKSSSNTTNSIAIAKGAIVSIVGGGGYSGGTVSIQYSSNNSNWTNVATAETAYSGRESPVIATAIVPPGFVRLYGSGSGYDFHCSYTIQKFS